jgi:hypothetical protein
LDCAAVCVTGFLGVGLLPLCVVRGAAQHVNEQPTKSIRQSPVEIRNLSLADSVALPTPPPTALLSQTKCDLKANLYVVQSISPPSLIGSGVLSSIPVSKLSLDSKATVLYPIPTLDRFRGVIRADFEVSADGTLYSLLEGLDAVAKEEDSTPSFFVAKYHDDGSLDSYFKLRDTGERHLQPSRLAMFRNGNVLVTGTAVNERKALQPFIAVFDTDGTFVREVKISDLSKALVKSPDSPGPTGDRESATRPTAEQETSESGRAVALSSSNLMVGAPDGYVYLLRDAARPRLYVLSSAGEEIGEFEIAVPAPGLMATNMALDGKDRVFISFGHVKGSSSAPDSSDGPDDLISVVNPRTGETSAVYRVPAQPEQFNMPACAAGSDDFLFLGATTDQQHQLIARYSPR